MIRVDLIDASVLHDKTLLLGDSSSICSDCTTDGCEINTPY